MPKFTPPIVEDRPWSDGLMRYFGLDVGVTVIRTTGASGPVFTQVRAPSSADLEAADKFWIGGRTYDITDQDAVELTAAGYAAGITP